MCRRSVGLHDKLDFDSENSPAEMFLFGEIGFGLPRGIVKNIPQLRGRLHIREGNMASLITSTMPRLYGEYAALSSGVFVVGHPEVFDRQCAIQRVSGIERHKSYPSSVASSLLEDSAAEDG